MQYPFDITGTLSSNLVTERHILTDVNNETARLIVPFAAPFYFIDIKMDTGEELIPLVNEVDYELRLFYAVASYGTRKPIHGAVFIKRPLIEGELVFTMQILGGGFVSDARNVYRNIANGLYNPRTVYFDQVTDIQDTFPPIDHLVDINDTVGADAVVASIQSVSQAIVNKPSISDVLLNQYIAKVGRLESIIMLLDQRLSSLEEIV